MLAQLALGQAHQAPENSDARKDQLALFRNQITLAFHNLALAKAQSSDLNKRILAAFALGQCSLMLGQPELAIVSVDDGIAMAGKSPDVPTYYAFGKLSERSGNFRQAAFFYDLGIYKATQEEAAHSHGVQDVLSLSARGFHLASGAYQNLADLPTAETLARCAIEIEEVSQPLSSGIDSALCEAG